MGCQRCRQQRQKVFTAAKQGRVGMAAKEMVKGVKMMTTPRRNVKPPKSPEIKPGG